MHRRVSSLIKGAAASSSSSSGVLGPIEDDNTSATSTVIRDIMTPSLKVKRVDLYYSWWTKSWKYRNTNSKITVEGRPMIKGGENDVWKDYSFVIVRTVSEALPTFKLVVKSPYILKACKDVIRSWPGVSWNSDPLELDPDIFITFRKLFLEYAANLEQKKPLSLEEEYTLSSVELLNNTIATDYRVTLEHIDKLTSHGEITFETLYAILVPRGLMVAPCALTGLPQLFVLEGWTRTTVSGKPMIQLNLESVDLVDQTTTHNIEIGRVSTTISIMYMKGIVKITSLDCYPLQFHPECDALVEQVKERGRKWKSLIGVHHRQYNGVAEGPVGKTRQYAKYNVKSRIMVDRSGFRRQNPGYGFPTVVKTKRKNEAFAVNDSRTSLQDGQNRWPGPEPWPSNSGVRKNLARMEDVSDSEAELELSDDDLLLTPTIVYGFSLQDKVWLEFSVERISPIVWDEDAFANLVLPVERKELLQSLVEAHHAQVGVSDFIRGKGEGLVVNLFGPPGVGKTFSAEATSEHVRRPLYIVGGGDLGTTAATLDQSLERIFEVATTWKAIVLIDEADVFLEQRSLHDLERNAMVAVFLRHVEYYRGILFLTTNRVETFDEAFLSRIHVALHFGELSQESKEKVWAAFISRMGPEAAQNVTPEQIKELARRNINGRQIKNAARTAYSLAHGKGERIGYDHFRLTLDAMDEFNRHFEHK